MNIVALSVESFKYHIILDEWHYEFCLQPSMLFHFAFVLTPTLHTNILYVKTSACDAGWSHDFQ